MTKSILIISEFFYPAYKAGGPTKSILNLANTLKHDYNVKVICSSKDLESLKNHNVLKLNKWFKYKGYSIIYCTNFIFSIKEIFFSRYTVNCDFLYLGSFFNPIYSLLPALSYLGSKKTIIIAPKGEFFKGALLQKKLKKSIVLFIFKLLFKFINIRWHATNEIEKKVIQCILKKNNSEIVVSSNIIKFEKISTTHIQKHKQKNKLNILICGRISPVKNIIASLDYILRLKGGIKVEIWGQIDDANYWELCLKKISKMPNNISIKYNGTFHPNSLKKIFDKKDVLLMPSLSENFGYAIFESLSFGVPVITSQNTPWTDLNNEEIGFSIDLSNHDKFVESLEYFQMLDNKELNHIRKKCINYASNYAITNIKENKRTLLNDLFKCN